MSKKFNGLSEEEVVKSREEYGSNKIVEAKEETFFQKVIETIKEDNIMHVLIFALIVQTVFAFFGLSEWIDSIAIAFVVMIATCLSTYSEMSMGKKFKTLQDEASKIKVKVYRNSKVEEIFIDDLVKGDYLIVQAGDKIPADGIVIDGQFKVDNSALNGESREIQKIGVSENTEYDDKVDFEHKFKTYRGAIVTSGEGVMKITSVGMSSEYGKLVQAMEVEEIESPLQLKLRILAEKISTFGKVGAVLIAIAFMFHKIILTGSLSIYFGQDIGIILNDFVSAIILAVIIIVMAVPEGLPLMIAIVLSQNMKKLLNKNVLVRKLIGIETAGSLNILFSDKTGTITKGVLEVVKFIGGDLKVSSSYSEIPDKLRGIVNISVSKNTGAMYNNKDKVVGGNATDRAVLSYIDKKEIEEGYEVLNVSTFSSDKKYSATQVIKEGKKITLYKGAVEKILDKCKFCYDKNGEKIEFTNYDKINNEVNTMASNAIRVIALATSEEDIIEGVLPTDLTLVGVMGIRDDVRPEAIEAIREVKKAGVQVVMITGDRKETAIAIATDSGLLESEKDIVLTHDELDKMSDNEVKEIIPNLRVISRALPLDKQRLVRLSQELNLVVGMTGDGVNDAPALKKADVGFSMGITGTEVAKEASDIVIMDDNFKSIVDSILYGRTIYNNIRKFINFQLTINVCAVLVSLISPFLGVEEPLSVTQILWVNLVMDTLGAIAFGGEPALKKYMLERPKSRSEEIVSKKMWSSILTSGVLISIFSLWFLKGDIFKNMFRGNIDPIYHLTGYFAFFIIIAVFNAFNIRSEDCNILKGIKDNPNFIKVMSLIAVVQILMVYIGGEVLRTKPLTLIEWGIVIGLSFLIIPIDMLRKLIMNKK